MGDDLIIKEFVHDGRRVKAVAGDGTSHYMKYDNTLGGIILNGYGGIAFETNGTNERLRIRSDGKISTPLGTTTRIGVADRTSGTGAGGSLCVTAGSARGSGQNSGDLILFGQRKQQC